MGRALRGRRFPGGRRRQLPHEQQRGHRQPRSRSCWAACAASTSTFIPTTTSTTGNRPTTCFPTAMRLATLLELEKLYAALDNFIAALEEKGKEFHHVLKSGRTHMQDAVPMRLGQEFHGLCARDQAGEEVNSRAIGIAARDRARRIGGRHRHQHPSRLSQEGNRQPVAHLGAEAARRSTTCATPCNRTWRCPA